MNDIIIIKKIIQGEYLDLDFLLPYLCQSCMYFFYDFNVFVTIWNKFSRKLYIDRGVRELPLAAGINEGGHYFR